MSATRPPPGAVPVERATTDDNKAVRYTGVLAALHDLLLKGVPWRAIFRQSLRVGSHNALATFDGFDGSIVASGAAAGVFTEDQTGAGNWAGFSRNAGVVNLTTSEGGVLGFAAATMLAVEPAWTAATLLNGWVNFGAPFNSAQYRKEIPSGRVYLRGTVKSGTATAGTTLLTLPTGFRPTAVFIFAVTSNSAHGECRVDTGGNVQIFTGSNVYFCLDGIHFDTQ